MFSCANGRLSLGLKNKFELAMVNEPSVFELLRFDCSVLYSWSEHTDVQEFLSVLFARGVTFFPSESSLYK